ncbi:MAG: hypothetical protein J6386_09325 [Candidatus Synoicihabitans palmerolidicus]|nr:hypothetical protein [Candidatus Synoicihabitans palmerolidicus]
MDLFFTCREVLALSGDPAGLRREWPGQVGRADVDRCDAVALGPAMALFQGEDLLTSLASILLTMALRSAGRLPFTLIR